MSRRRRHRSQRLARERHESLEDLKRDTEKFAQEMRDDGLGALGMTDAQVDELIGISVRTMAQRMTREGYATKAPWGVIFNPDALRGSAELGMLMLSRGDHAVDDRGSEADLEEDESIRMMLEVVHGCLTMASASILYLRSLPLPFALAQHLTANPVSAMGDIDR